MNPFKTTGIIEEVNVLLFVANQPSMEEFSKRAYQQNDNYSNSRTLDFLVLPIHK